MQLSIAHTDALIKTGKGQWNCQWRLSLFVFPSVMLAERIVTSPPLVRINFAVGLTIDNDVPKSSMPHLYRSYCDRFPSSSVRAGCVRFLLFALKARPWLRRHKIVMVVSVTAKLAFTIEFSLESVSSSIYMATAMSNDHIVRVYVHNGCRVHSPIKLCICAYHQSQRKPCKYSGS